MKSLILQTATRLILTLLLLFAIFILLRGHHEPGGGFIGGLVATGAFVLYAIAYDVESARQALPLDPRTLLAIGLLLAALSGTGPLLAGQPFLTGKWFAPTLGGYEWIELGTPLLFDFGVFLVVIGVGLTIIFALMEE